MKAYHEYLELHGYFSRGRPALSRAEFDGADAEFKVLAQKHPKLDDEERRRLAQLKDLLHRDRP